MLWQAFFSSVCYLIRNGFNCHDLITKVSLQKGLCQGTKHTTLQLTSHTVECICSNGVVLDVAQAVVEKAKKYTGLPERFWEHGPEPNLNFRGRLCFEYYASNSP